MLCTYCAHTTGIVASDNMQLLLEQCTIHDVLCHGLEFKKGRGSVGAVVI